MKCIFPAERRRALETLLAGLALACSLRLGWGAEPAPAAEANPPLGWREAQFDQSAPYGSQAEVQRRLGVGAPLQDYPLAEERFRIYVPASCVTNGPCGLLVWLSPGDDPRIPAAWETVLGEQRLFFVAARNSGNTRDATQRCRLALDALCNMSRRYRIDADRLFVGGFSGGGRLASILGVAYADLFRGALPICGVDFYRAVPGSPGEYYPATYRPAPAILARAKAHGRFVLVTGERDMNRLNTRSVFEHGFQREGFQRIYCLDVAGMGHSLPESNVLTTAFELLLR